MEKLAKKYQKFLVEEAPEQLEELIYSEYLKKWCILYHSRDFGTPGVHILDDCREMTEEFLKTIAFHTNADPAFKAATTTQKLEILNKELCKYKELLAKYIDVSEELINSICDMILDTYYK